MAEAMSRETLAAVREPVLGSKKRNERLRAVAADLSAAVPLPERRGCSMSQTENKAPSSQQPTWRLDMAYRWSPTQPFCRCSGLR